MATICKHPRVRIVSRHEDTEFVECLECGEVFDSEEFHDMEIEETVETEDVSDDDLRPQHHDQPDLRVRHSDCSAHAARR